MRYYRSQYFLTQSMQSSLLYSHVCGILLFSSDIYTCIPNDILIELGHQPSVTLFRLKDCANIIFSISKILMLYGVTSLLNKRNNQRRAMKKRDKIWTKANCHIPTHQQSDRFLQQTEYT
ncbi:hypothetical protein FGO68_gene16568 [Halteria grandinella]|uniref:Uncharacterized protein n=1 Tax=Halteria grandinella TaxID=5974 RepID=A0A8J8NNK9_HALGN|nr:hypothetical protein FGO68_gene16568 [Halteria grandinella]